MALIGAILVEIKIIEIVYKRSLREGDRYALNYGKEVNLQIGKVTVRRFLEAQTTHAPRA